MSAFFFQSQISLVIKVKNLTSVHFLFVDLVETQMKELILDIKYPATKKQVSMYNI